MTREEEILIREAALFCWQTNLTGGSQYEMTCRLCGGRVYQRMPNLAEAVTVAHAEKHLGSPLRPQDATIIASLHSLGCPPEQIIQQVTGHPPCIDANPRPNL